MVDSKKLFLIGHARRLNVEAEWVLLFILSRKRLVRIVKQLDKLTLLSMANSPLLTICS